MLRNLIAKALRGNKLRNLKLNLCHTASYGGKPSRLGSPSHCEAGIIGKNQTMEAMEAPALTLCAILAQIYVDSRKLLDQIRAT